MDTDTDFRDILRNEGRFSPSDTLIDRLLENSDEISLKSGKVLIGYGQTDTNIYIVKDGIIQLLYFKGEKEVTFGFAFPVLQDRIIRTENPQRCIFLSYA